MALQGKFPHDVELVTLIQSIYFDKKTGVLYLTKEKDEAAIGFEEGYVVASYIIRKGEFETLPRYLVLSGRVREDIIKEAEKESQKRNLGVDEILLGDGIITREELEKIIIFKIEEVIDEILTWKEGNFYFVPEDRIYKFSKIKVKIDPQYLLMEAMRRQGELLKMRKRIPSENLIPFPKDIPEIDIELSKEEIKVLELVDGEKNINEIAERSGIGRFKTFEALYHLLEMGWIDLREKEKLIPLKKEEIHFPELKFYEKKRFLYIVGGIILAFFLFFSFYFGLFFKNIKTLKFIPDIFDEEKKVAEFLWKR
ncbi:MAG: DUF4388 domain-containing protein [candidate division WOR-3 bacterium]